MTSNSGAVFMTPDFLTAAFCLAHGRQLVSVSRRERQVQFTFADGTACAGLKERLLLHDDAISASALHWAMRHLKRIIHGDVDATVETGVAR